MINNIEEIINKCTLAIIISILMISIGLQSVHAFEDNSFNLEYEYINIKDMAPIDVANKKDIENMNSLTSLLITNLSLSNDNTEDSNYGKVEEVSFKPVRTIEEIKEKPKVVWHLPTEMGTISQYPHYGHAAYDITSPRGSNEFIFPVANGVISSIYTDSAGALIVTVLHNVDGRLYTSLYAHLSSYANGLYVGKEVTINDCLGRMGTTGNSTGVHLHLIVADCALFNPNDGNCRDLNSFFNYINVRTTQGYFGLGNLMYVPASWNSR